MDYQDKKKLPLVSSGLVIINIVLFLFCLFGADALYESGALSVYGVLVKGEYGRILWATFLHSGTNHLCNNMVILFFLGAMIEKEVGHTRFGLFYFVSGVGGNVASLLVKAVTHNPIASIGASGAVFGLDGVLLAMVLLGKRQFPDVTIKRVLLMIALSLYGGFTGGHVDNAAHVGGLLTGFCAGAIMCGVQRLKGKRCIQ